MYLCADRYNAYTGLSLPSASSVISRSSGVGPLSVFLDLTSITCATTSKPFIHLYVRVRWGDGSAGVFTTPKGGSKNLSTGLCAAHVYTQPGSYTWIVDVFNGQAWKHLTGTVIVWDPDEGSPNAFDEYHYFSTDGSFTGAPAEDSRHIRHTGTNFGALVNAWADPRRCLLFQNGQNFNTSTTTAVLNKNGPGMIRSFTFGTSFTVSGGGGVTYVQVGADGILDIGDWRICDMVIDGGGNTSSQGFSAANGDFDRLLYLRVTVQNAGYGFLQGILQKNQGHAWEEHCWQDCVADNIDGSGGNGWFIGGIKVALLGCTATDSSGDAEHNFRSMYLKKAVISNCDFRRPNSDKHCLAVRSPSFGTVYGTTPIDSGSEVSQYVVINDTWLDAGALANSPMAFCSDGGHDQRMRDVVVERCIWPAGDVVSGGCNVGGAWQGKVAVRNNIINMTASTAFGHNAITVQTDNGSAPRSREVEIYNNSAYTGAALGTSTNHRAVNLNSTCESCTAKNNLSYAPVITNGIGVTDSSAGSPTSVVTHNSTDNQTETVAPFAGSPAPFAANDFRPIGYAAGGGDNTVPVYDDYNGDMRGYGNKAPVMDMGALKAA